VVKDGPNGYNFWGCSSFDCPGKYEDENGKPSSTIKKNESPPPSKFKCPKCKNALFHRQGFSEKTKKDYNFYSCSNKSCKNTYKADSDNTPIF
jgi:ssDNA-binding Zn-finger/Zn-ribbon topoisomerase 1